MRLINLFKRKPIAIITLPIFLYDEMNKTMGIIKWADLLKKDYHVLIYTTDKSDRVEIEIFK